MENAELDTLTTYLQEEVGNRVAKMSASMFAAVMDDCVASRIDTHPSVSVPPSKQWEVLLKFLDRDCSPRCRDAL